MNEKDWLEAAIAICALAGIVYRIGKTEGIFTAEIEKLKVSNLEQTREFDYKLNSLNAKLDYRVSQLRDDIKQVQSYLLKLTDFRIRKREEDEDEE